MENDDRPVGRILSRREFLALLGTAGAAMLAACAPGQSGAGQPTSAATQAPYASKGQRDTLNSTDRIYDDQLLLAVTETEQGYAAIFDIGLQLD